MKRFHFLLAVFAAMISIVVALPSVSRAETKGAPRKLESPYYVFPRTGAQHLDLSSGWELTACDSLLNDPALLDGKEWLTVETPTSVQMAYYKAGKYPHPYKNLNSEKYYRQLEQKVHYYRKSFPTPPVRESDYVILSFDGIDYTARIWVNGNLLGQHEGMYGGPTVKINEYLKKDGSDNEVVVEVRSANYQFLDFKPRTPKKFIHTWFFSHGNVTPCFHVGMWNGARLDILPYYHLERPFLSTRSIADGKAVLDFSAEIFSGKNSKDYSLHRWNNHQASSLARKIRYSGDDVTVILRLFDGDKEAYVRTFHPTVAQERCWMEESFELDHPKLWNPNGLGKPDFYRASVELVVNGTPTDKIAFDFGVRTIEHVRSAGVRIEDRWNNWQFIVNGKKIFVKGINWKPLDSLSELKEEDYEWSIRAARDMGVQIFRIWGSGYLETETFYRLCAKYGIMVWQDFPIANYDTPEWPQDVWEAQVCQNIFRLRNHPALAIWCGGNEFNPYCLGNAASVGILERNLREFDPTRPFWRTSPDGGSDHLYPDFDPNHYKDYVLLPFVAETGIHTMSSARNNRAIIAPEDFRNLGGMYEPEFKENHPDFVHHFAEYSASRVPRMLSRASHIDDLSDPAYEDIVEATHVGAGEFYHVLSEGLQSNYPVTTGLMPWVFKRSWPVVAAIQLMDYYGQPTGPYYFLKRTYEKTHVLVDLPRMLFAPGDSIPLKVNVLNGIDAESFGGRVSLRILDDRFRELQGVKKDVPVPAGTSVAKTELGAFVIPADYHERYFFLVAELSDKSGKLVSRSVYWPRTIKQMEDPDYYQKYLTGTPQWPTLKEGPWLKPVITRNKTRLGVGSLEKVEDGVYRFTVTNQGKNPSPMTVIDLDGGIFTTSDNYFWLEPGESKEISVTIKPSSPVGGIPTKVLVTSWNAKTQTLTGGGRL